MKEKKRKAATLEDEPKIRRKEIKFTLRSMQQKTIT
jgi:hypothetical protein